jgi:hypothetical protein
LYVQPHREWRPGFVLPFHFHGAPLSLSFKFPRNVIGYPGIDPVGRAGHMTIARGEELTNRQAWVLNELVRLGPTPLHDGATPANQIRFAFGGYASSPPWRLLTARLFHKLGWSDTGQWWRTDPLGSLLPRPAPEEKQITYEQERRDVGTQIGAGVYIPIPGAGGKARLAVFEAEHALTPKDGVPVEREADPERAQMAADHAAEAHAGLANLATELKGLAGYQAGDPWPGSPEAKTAIDTMEAAGRELTPENIAKLINTMNAWKTKSGGSLSLDTLSALGNEYWAPGKVWKPDQEDAAKSLLYVEMAKRAQPSLTDLANQLQSTVGGANDEARTAVDAIRAAGENLNAQTHQAMKDAVADWFRSWSLRPPSDILDPASWTVTDRMAATLQSQSRLESEPQTKQSLARLGDRLQMRGEGPAGEWLGSPQSRAAVEAILAAGRDLNAQAASAMNAAIAHWLGAWGVQLPGGADILGTERSLDARTSQALSRRLGVDIGLTVPADGRAAYRWSSPAARLAFGAVAMSGGEWKKPVWEAVSALVNRTLASPPSQELRDAAQSLRNVLGTRWTGKRPITLDQNAAMDAFFTEDARATQRDALQARSPAVLPELIARVAENRVQSVTRPTSA